MRVLLIGPSGRLGTAVHQALTTSHEVVTASRNGSDVTVDIRDPQAIAGMYEQVGRVDAVACAAGAVPYKPLTQLEPEDFQAGIADKLLGQVELVRRGAGRVADDGSFTLITGVLARQQISDRSRRVARQRRAGVLRQGGRDRATGEATDQRGQPDRFHRGARRLRLLLPGLACGGMARLAGRGGFGGWVLKLLDDAAVIAATRHCRTRVVTAAVDGVRFRQPVNVGDVLSFRASVNAAWRTSMEVGVRVEAENTITDTTTHVLTAYLTMVALDGEGATTKVPDLNIDGPDASRRWQEAQLRRDIRLAAPADLHQLHAALRVDTARELVP